MYRITSIILALTLLLPQVAQAEGPSSFSDIDRSHPNYSSIMYLKNRGIIKGYDDGSFQPNREITRAELLKIGLLSNDDVKVNPEDRTTEFKDIKEDDWVNPFAAKAKALGAVKGTESGNFEANRTITKVELLKILYTIYKIEPGSGENEFGPKDVKVEEWKFPYVDFALQHGFIGLDNNFHSGADSPATRAFTADVIYRLQLLKHGGETQSRLMRSEARLIEGLKRMKGKSFGAALKWIDRAVELTDSSKFDLDNPEHQGIVDSAHSIAKSYQIISRAGQKVLDGEDANLEELNIALVLAIEAAVGNPNKTMLALTNQAKGIVVALLKL